MGVPPTLLGMASTIVVVGLLGERRFEHGDVELVEELRALLPGPKEHRFALPLRRGFLAHGWRVHDGLVLVAVPWDGDTRAMDETMARLDALSSSRATTDADGWIPPPDDEGPSGSAPAAQFAVPRRSRPS